MPSSEIQSVNLLAEWIISVYCFTDAVLSLDAMDLSGEQHVNIHHNIYKRKLDLQGRPIEDPERQECEL